MTRTRRSRRAKALTPPTATPELDRLLRAIAADPDAGPWRAWAARLLASGKPPAKKQ